ncbi:GGDEF domain-containing protein [Solibacillus sp. CAU 1738]|uniref:GGDEF domain-containing protein n=1 Tax=Solibacillus sp. CAU 1738 TaxID=3140363 RepID=UPI003260936C
MIYIGEIVEWAINVEPTIKNKIIDQHFNNNPQLRGLVVTKQGVPISYISRLHFYEKVGTLYDYNLFMGRKSNLIAKPTPLIVDYYRPIVDVSKLAMDRFPEDLYDDIIVTRDGYYVGVVSVRSLLLKLVDIQVEFASLLNPLSYLPSSHLIEEKLHEILADEMYSVIYFDIDHFKMYNDLYGFKKGDEVLLFMTELLKQYIPEDIGFLGHIGGDDFIAIYPTYNVEEMCARIIADFDQQIIYYYDEQHLVNDVLFMNGRTEQIERFLVSTLSIAIVNNRFNKYESVNALSDTLATVKSDCKKIPGSCYIVNGHTALIN